MPTPADYDDGTDPVIPSTPSPFLPGSVPSGDTYLRNSNIDRIMPYVGRPLSQVPSATPAAFRTVPPPQTTPASFSFDDPAFGGRGNQVAAVPRPPREERSPGIHPVPEGVLTPPLTSPNNPWFMNTPRGEPAQTPFQPQINRYSNEYGLPPALFNALIHAESGYKPGAVSSTGAIGLGQLEPGTAREMGVRNPYDPDQNLQGAARYLRQMYDRYGSWSKAVSAYNRGPGGAEKTGFSLAGYQGYGPGRALIATAAALDGGLVKAGPLAPPPQNYRPESYGPNRWTPDRPPSQWGRDTPDMFSGIGAIPHQREIPGIMKALAPLLMVGLSIFSKGAALPMLSFYGGYLKASAAKQDKDAKELKTKYQDQLKELKAKMGIELAAYGGAGGDMSELRNLAVEFGDQTLLGILDAGKDPGPLLQQRDRIFKDTSKTDLAERRFQLETERFDLQRREDQLRDDRANAKDDREKQRLDEEIKKNRAKQDELQKQIHSETVPYGPSEEQPEAPAASPEAPAESPEAPAAPAPTEPPAPASGESPAAPAPSETAPPAAEPSAPGRGAEATPPATTPAAAPVAPQQATAPTGGEDKVVDAQGNAIPRRSDVVPAAYTGAPGAPGESAAPSSTTTLPQVGVGALGPSQYSPAQLGAIGLSPERLDQNARTYLETGREVYRGGASGDPLAVQRNEAVARRAAQMQSFIDRVIRDTKPGDLEGALQKIGTADPGLASVARSVDKGDMPGPSGWQLRAPFYQNVQKLVTSLDPDWDASRWVTNYRTKVAYHVGTQSNQIRSANTALAHMSTLWDMADAMHNGQFPTVNAMRNWWKTQTGHEAATDFVAARAAVARELERAFRGTGGAWGEIKEDLKNVNENSSPEQIQGYIRTVTELLKGQLDSLADLYQGGTGKTTTGDDLLSPAARSTFHRFQRLELGAGGAPIPQAGAEPSVLDDTATYPPNSAYGPGPAPAEQGNWTAQPEQ